MSTTKSTGVFRVALRTPVGEAVLGVFLLVAGVVFTLYLFTRGTGGATVLGVLLFVVFAGFGVILLVMAWARARWARAYRQVHGHPPF